MFNKTPAVENIEKLKTGMDSLKDFVELVNDPEKIKAAHAIVRQEHTLTEEQAKKFQDALAFSEKYAGLATTYNERVEILEQAEQLLAKLEEQHKTKVEQDTLSLDERESTVSAAERQVIADREKLELDGKEQERKYSELRTPVDDDIEQNRKDKAANEAEKLRLQKLAKKLDKRDKSVKAAVDSAADEDEEIAA